MLNELRFQVEGTVEGFDSEKAVLGSGECVTILVPFTELASIFLTDGLLGSPRRKRRSRGNLTRWLDTDERVSLRGLTGIQNSIVGLFSSLSLCAKAEQRLGDVW